MKNYAIFGAAALSLMVMSPVSAAVITFAGADPGVGPGGAAPNSTAAALSFATVAGSLGTVQLLTLEGLSTGNFTTKALGSGVTATQVGALGTASISNTGTVTSGYNTTSGGSKFLSFVPGNTIAQTTQGYSLSFAAPIQAFGAFFTGVGSASGTLQLSFTDGTNQILTVQGSGPNGGISYFGFTDVGKSISTVSLLFNTERSINDSFGLDDISFVNTLSSVPEPDTFLPLAALASAIGFLTLRKRNQEA
jgi:hypothetical protein